MVKALVVLCAVLLVALVVSEDCSNFNGLNGCQGNNVDMNPTKINRMWQTPPRNDPAPVDPYYPSYQDMSSLQGYVQTVYSSDHQSATVTVLTNSKNAKATFKYSFNGVTQDSNVFKATSALTEPLQVIISGSDGTTLVLDDVYFLWQNAPIKTPSNYMNGQKGGIVEMFGWPYADIEQECKSLSQMGWMGVKVYPPQESVFSWDELQNGHALNPWWFLYQPVSYRLNARAGSYEQLRQMITTCRSYNVRVYADAVINHMSGGGNDAFTHHRNGNGGGCATWGGKISTGALYQQQDPVHNINMTRLSPYWSQDFTYLKVNYTGQPSGLEYSAVPYGPLDFHCERALNSWNDPLILNAGWLEGLADLNTERDNVQTRIAQYLTDLLSIGFSGFRIDAAKHIRPDDLAAILGKFKSNLGGSIPDDFITYLEVLIGGEKDLLECQHSPYQYSTYFAEAMAKAGLSNDDIQKVKIWESDYPLEFPVCGSYPDKTPSTRFAIQNDCSDDQNPGSSSRDMQDKGSVLVKEKNISRHRYFNSLLFSRNDTQSPIRLVLSSYTLNPSLGGSDGHPDGYSDCKRCVGAACPNCVSVPYQKAHDPNACGYTVFDSNGSWSNSNLYTRTHRDKSVILAMRSWMGLSTSVSNSDLGLPDSCKENFPA